jgi:hypothetical protein
MSDTRDTTPVPLTPPDADGGAAGFRPGPDARPPMPEPPPVRLLSVADVTVLAHAGVERAMDDLYVGVLRFEREDAPPDPRAVPARPGVEPVLGDAAPRVPPARVVRPLPALPAGAFRGPVYRAERFRLCVQVREAPVHRDDLRPTAIEVPSLPVLTAQLDDRQVEYTRQRGLTPGEESVLFQDPAGNWLEVTGMRPI